MTNKYVSKIVAGGNTLYVKDAEAREALTSKVDVDSALNNVAYDSTNKKLTKTVGSTTSDIVSVATIKSDLQLSKSDVGLGNVTNDAQVKRSEMGVASGVAQLDLNGKVPSSQLPSYVDDVIEGYYNDSKFYTTYTPGEEEGDPDTYSGEITAESGKIYVDKASNLSYRWSGSAFIGISSPLALGETSSTAYAGDKGKAVTDNFNTHAANNDIHVTAADKTAWNAKSNFSGSYNDLTDKPTIETEVEIGSTSPVGDVKLFVDTNADYNIEVYNKTQANNKFSKVIDLNSAPTSSTISYTEDSNTVYFKVGDEVRVPDQDADNGYTFYKLYKLETVSDVITATWDKLGAGGAINPNETVNISLTQVGGNNADLIGASITITDDYSGDTLYTDTWAGAEMTTEIPIVTYYTVSVETIAGYLSCEPQSYHAGYQTERNIGFQYRASGAFIEATDGTLYKSSTWASSGKTANSIVVLTDNCKFRMALSEISLPIHSNNTDPIQNYISVVPSDIAAIDYNGKDHTDRIVQFNAAYDTNTPSYAAPYCKAFSFTFPSGQKGYLPAGGQWRIACLNKTEIDACLSACNGTPVTNIWLGTSTYMGISNNQHRFYVVSWGGGGIGGALELTYPCIIRPFADYE